MANESGPPETQPDKPPEKLPEPLENARGIVETAKWLYRRVRRRWGRVAGVGVVCALIIALLWSGWPEIRERPGVEPVVDWLQELTTRIPTCDGKNFCVAVADLQKDPDDKWESAIFDAVENLEDVVGGNEGAGQGATAKTGIEVIRIPRTISTSGNKTGVAETRAFEEAQRYLEKSRADLVIWGSVVEVGEKSGPRVFWTTTTATKRSSNLLNSTDLELPADFWSQLATMLQLVVVTQYAQVSSQEGHYVADTLAPFIKKVRELIPQTHGAGWTDQSRFQIKSLLAESLMIYGEQAGDNAALEEAIGYYQELAQLYPRERAPLDWASNQNNLGVAMGQLGEHELDASDLRLAVAAFRAALLEYTRDSVPLNWAMTENNLGNTLGELAERDQDPKQFCEAVEAHSAAWQIFQQTAPYDASIAVDGVKEDLRLIAKQSRPDLYATCLDNQRAVLKDMGLDTAEK